MKNKLTFQFFSFFFLLAILPFFGCTHKVDKVSDIFSDSANIADKYIESQSSKDKEREDFKIFMKDFYKAVKNNNLQEAKTIALRINNKEAMAHAMSLLDIANASLNMLLNGASGDWSDNDLLSETELVKLAMAIFENRNERFSDAFLNEINKTWYHLYEVSLIQIGEENQALTSVQIQIAKDKCEGAISVADKINDRKRRGLSYIAKAWIYDRTGDKNEVSYCKYRAAYIFNVKVTELPYPPIKNGSILKP